MLSEMIQHNLFSTMHLQLQHQQLETKMDLYFKTFSFLSDFRHFRIHDLKSKKMAHILIIFYITDRFLMKKHYLADNLLNEWSIFVTSYTLLTTY